MPGGEAQRRLHAEAAAEVARAEVHHVARHQFRLLGGEPSLHAHTILEIAAACDEALPLVRHHVEVFEPYDVVVAPSGSCVGSVRHQHAMVARRAGDEALAVRAEAVAAKTYELSELLVDVLGVEDVGAYYPHRVTYHPTCHSLRLLRVGDKPLRLLRSRLKAALWPRFANRARGWETTPTFADSVARRVTT